MSQLKAKQLKLPEAGALLIGGVGGTGTTISASGKDDQVLRVVSGSPVWSVNDHLNSINTFNKITAADETGVKIAVENVDGTEAVDFATFKSGVTTDENFEFSGETGRLTVAAKGTEADIDIVIAPQGNGEVIIGNAGGGIIQADDDEDLALLGGAGSGNLFLNGGGTGKIYYASDATDPDLEIATVGAVTAATEAAKVTQTRSEFNGSQTFVLADKTIPASIIVHLNGLTVKSELYAYNGTTKVVTFNTGVLGYTLDAADQIVFTYEVTA